MTGMFSSPIAHISLRFSGVSAERGSTVKVLCGLLKTEQALCRQYIQLENFSDNKALIFHLPTSCLLLVKHPV